VIATSNPTMGASASSGPSSQVNRAWSWVAVDRAGQPEPEAGELALHHPDGGRDRLSALGHGQRVDVARVLGVQLVDGPAAGGGVGLVPGGDVALRQVVERVHQGASS